MLKYLAILSLGLMACGGSSITATPAPQTAHQSEPSLEVTSVRLEAAAAPVNDPVDVELSGGRHAQAVHCSSELDCLQKLAGVCPNGYQGGQTLSDGTHTVGALFRCISDEEKAQAAREAAEEKAQEAAYRAAVVARIQAEKDAAAAAQSGNKKTGGVKPALTRTQH